MKRLLLFFVLVLASHAQVVQQLFLNTATSPQNIVVTNTGQIGHTVRIQFSNNGGNTCVNPNPATIELDYSFDGSTWIAFSLPSKMPPLVLTQTFLGSGLFNYVRFSLSGWDTVNCVASAWYTGSTQQPTVQSLTPAISFQPFVNYVGTTTFVTVPANGQTTHQIWAQLSNAPGHTCASTDKYTLNLYGFLSGSAVQNFIANLGITGAGIGGPAFGSGAYQAMQLSVTPAGSASTDCSLNAFYTGSFAGNLPAVSAFLPASGGSNGVAFPVPITHCGLTANVAVTAGSTSVIAFGGGASANVRVCELVITTPTAAAVATVSTAAHGGSCASPTTLGTFNMAVGVPIRLGGGLGNVIALSGGNDLCLGAATGNVNGIVSYDFL